jgi:ABC-2 type transport system ATP-binding protein
MSESLLQVENVHKHYGSLQALKGVSFHVERGELFGLLGPNGAGKTTLISIVSGLLRPTSGHTTIQGLTVEEARSLIGLVPQDLAIYLELTARENLEFFGRLYGLRGADLRRRTDEVLDAIGLLDRANDRTGTFSGGMKRRLNLGVALMHRPKLLLLDEPTTGVDPQSRNRIFEEVRRLNQAGMTIVYTSHYMEEVQALCPRVGILDGGQLIACDRVASLLRLLPGQIRFRLPTVPELWTDRLTQLADGNWKRLDDTQFEILATDVPQTLLRLAAVLSDWKLQPTEIEANQPNLEKVFLHLTGRALRD